LHFAAVTFNCCSCV